MMNQLILRPVTFAHSELDFLLISSMFSKGRTGWPIEVDSLAHISDQTKFNDQIHYTKDMPNYL